MTPSIVPDHRYLAHILYSDNSDEIRIRDATPTKSDERLGRLHDEDHVQDAMSPDRVSSQYPSLRKTKNSR